ncbi:MAG: hypothetical protein IJ571_03425 [Ruminococcus sp.]|nr:hypothetical protein [Ruminococcus sp.]
MREFKAKLEYTPALCAAVYLVIWLCLTMLIWLFTAKLFVVYLLFALGFTLVYPIITCWTCFRFTRLFGIRWYVPVIMLAACVAEYVLLEDLHAVVPNYILLTVLCLLFSTGIGSVFTIAPAAKVKDQKNKKEQNYKKILDD